MKKLILGLGLATILCHSPAEGFMIGVKSMGRAGSVLADPVDAFTIGYNPAGLAWQGDRLDIGGYWLRQDGRTKIQGNSIGGMNGSFRSHRTCDFFFPEIAASTYICECDMVCGVAIYTQDFLKTTYGDVVPALGTTNLGMEYLHETVSIGGAIRFGCDHALGLSVDLMAQRFKISGLEVLKTGTFSDDPNKVTNKGYDYSLGVGGTVGWLSRFGCVTIGLAWSPEVSMEKFRKYKGLLAHSGKFHIPQKYKGGVAIEATDDFVIEIDVEHIAWNDISALDHPISKIDNPAPQFGEEDGVGLGWRDQLHWRVGFEWQFCEYASARAGYSHGRSPIRRSQAFLNMVAPYVIEEWITVGLTWQHSCCSEVSFYTGYGFQKNINDDDNIPGVFGGGDAGLKEREFQLGLSWSRFY